MTPGEVSRLANESIRLGNSLTESLCLLAIASQYAWFDSWLKSYREMSAGIEDVLARQARTSRLLRQGVPLDAAARGLHLV